jgi:hypothetical protein
MALVFCLCPIEFIAVLNCTFSLNLDAPVNGHKLPIITGITRANTPQKPSLARELASY